MKELITVGIIDKDEQVRIAIKRLIGEYNSTNQKLTIEILFDRPSLSTSKIRQSPAPDILILDVDDQDLRALEPIKRVYPEIDLVILTNNDEIKMVRRCFRNGAVSYLSKQSCLSVLVNTIINTPHGASYISPKISRALINQLRDSYKYETMLTARELQIANGIVEGMSYKMIAHRHELSLDTVRTYVKRVYRKLKINSKGELIAQLAV
ncbi:MAG: LuxR C-terminal-related transcriptional regulator [Sphingobacterium sp.]|uniref:LuxR C-terminal-related transcriptional regulator n=1 Tax=Sphingobacterium sp. JB170 TaxID=1434842 RepID=UPI00097EBF0B|nr:response regulator transcription factor [Sphingobacterium sp. JB170]SJN19508.1 Nitrate/nitrite response regulator protein [Sphingobacterium sp. JB170]